MTCCRSTGRSPDASDSPRDSATASPTPARTTPSTARSSSTANSYAPSDTSRGDSVLATPTIHGLPTPSSQQTATFTETRRPVTTPTDLAKPTSGPIRAATSSGNRHLSVGSQRSWQAVYPTNCHFQWDRKVSDDTDRFGTVQVRAYPCCHFERDPTALPGVGFLSAPNV